MKRIRFYFIPVLFLLLTVYATPGRAMSSPVTPQETVRTLLNTIKQIQDGDHLTDQQQASNQKLSKEALSLMDVAQVSEKTLGKYWDKRSDKERRGFVTLLSDLFRRVAFPNSAKFFSELELKFGDTRENQGEAVVPLKVLHKDEGEVQIDFMLNRQSQQWRVVDVILDGVSMRNNLRTQFYKVLKKDDYPELVRRMMKKLEETKS